MLSAVLGLYLGILIVRESKLLHFRCCGAIFVVSALLAIYIIASHYDNVSILDVWSTRVAYFQMLLLLIYVWLLKKQRPLDQ